MVQARLQLITMSQAENTPSQLDTLKPVREE
ncbi:hypothetical protein EcWSU1_02029 [Enterobacter ludwigii]|uniref:Uncharacterized protein n=1 Tax=Enterobacter ludwigii TaxID=299767 RepID=G8LN49_9ENTR|nr:hypothetical protein EcWSU1_02029 [Enterobacter ludwigii]